MTKLSDHSPLSAIEMARDEADRWNFAVPRLLQAAVLQCCTPDASLPLWAPRPLTIPPSFFMSHFYSLPLSSCFPPFRDDIAIRRTSTLEHSACSYFRTMSGSLPWIHSLRAFVLHFLRTSQKGGYFTETKIDINGRLLDIVLYKTRTFFCVVV
jgi:hypothetical protein